MPCVAPPHGPSCLSGRDPLAANWAGPSWLLTGQIRWGQKPDGVCLVVGGCARGFPEERNKTSDIIYTDSDLASVAHSPCQLFWEVRLRAAEQGATERLGASRWTQRWDSAC